MFATAPPGRGSEFLPHEQHRVVAISCVLRSREALKVWSSAMSAAGERS